MERKRITGYMTPSLSECHNELAKQVVEDCAKRYKIVPHGIHGDRFDSVAGREHGTAGFSGNVYSRLVSENGIQPVDPAITASREPFKAGRFMLKPIKTVPFFMEKGIETLCKKLDKLLKEVYKDYKRLDKYYHKKCRILEISDRVVYSTDYPLCDTLRDEEVCVRYSYIKRTAVMESHIISRDYSYDCRDFNAVVCASRITTNMRKITALLLWLRKYDDIDDYYTLKNKAVIVISNLHTIGNNAMLSSTCDITVNFYKGHEFDKRVSYSKKGRCSVYEICK